MEVKNQEKENKHLAKQIEKISLGNKLKSLQ